MLLVNVTNAITNLFLTSNFIKYGNNNKIPNAEINKLKFQLNQLISNFIFIFDNLIKKNKVNITLRKVLEKELLF